MVTLRLPQLRLSAALLLLGALASSVAAAGQHVVEGIRVQPGEARTRIVIDLDRPLGEFRHDLFRLDDPARVVVDLENTRLGTALPTVAQGGPHLRGLRAGIRKGSDLRVVLDLERPMRPSSFLLEPRGKYGHRLVLDVRDAATATASAQPVAIADPASPRPLAPPRGERGNEAVVVLDPGHGGHDPGALGRRGTREKTVVLQIAKRLKTLIDAEPGMRAVLTRETDKYLRLRDRLTVARKAGADLFISIHADAFRKRHVRGSSVYVLSHNGASSEAARWLAKRENESLLVGGVSLGDKPDVLRQVILDLSQTASMAASERAAEAVVEALGKSVRLHKRNVERARFVVLKAPDIPSMLVETAFISNEKDEAALRSPKQQAILAEALFEGISRYLNANPPPGTLLATREHRIVRGETLSGLAVRYGVSVDRLRSVNALQGSMLKVGQVLRIPPAAS